MNFKFTNSKTACSPCKNGSQPKIKDDKTSVLDNQKFMKLNKKLKIKINYVNILKIILF